MWAKLSLLVQPTKKRMVLSATPSVKRVTMELDQCAGRIVLMVSEMMVHSVPNRNLMVAEQEVSSIATTVRSGVSSGTQNARKASTTWRVAYVHQTVHRTLVQILVSLARRSHMEEPQESLFSAHLN